MDMCFELARLLGDRLEGSARIVDEDPDFSDGSYLIIQKYLHDLSAWNQLTVKDQEKAIGRTKMDDVEFPSGSERNRGRRRG